MAFPNITVIVEPEQNEQMAFSPLAAPKTGAATWGLFYLLLQISNQESDQIQLTQIDLTFTGNPSVSPQTFSPTDFWIPNGSSRNWVSSMNRKMVVRPIQTVVTLSLTFQDFNLAGFNSPKLASALVVYDDRGWEVVTSTKVTMYRC